jgi:hypothetical protein
MVEAEPEEAVAMVVVLAIPAIQQVRLTVQLVVQVVIVVEPHLHQEA